jgi:hypothetical protein
VEYTLHITIISDNVHLFRHWKVSLSAIEPNTTVSNTSIEHCEISKHCDVAILHIEHDEDAFEELTLLKNTRSRGVPVVVFCPFNNG